MSLSNQPSIDQHTVDVVSLTNAGPVRTHNEDSIAVVHASGYVPLSKGTLLVVADGIGGMKGGAVASSMVTSGLPALYFESTAINPVDNLVRAVSEINRRVYESGGAWREGSGMGSTVAACAIVHDSLITVNVGDSRAYLLHGNTLRQLSRDHSLRKLSPFAFRTNDSIDLSHVLTQAIGPLPSVKPHVNITRIVPDDILLLCSDGLTNVLSDDEIKDVITSSPFENIPDEMLKLVCEKEGDDNVSIVAARLVAPVRR